jgi:alkanesulfonate monooxygenase SsuD/methylene tetrahydromethanopterin reductase-like flavin-dependent oxidoreductase (luciferase family)
MCYRMWFPAAQPAVGPAEIEMLEGYTTLGYLTACTSRATLVTLVTRTVYREPGVLAKIVTTLDVLSSGRAWLGIGAAWNEEESRGLGTPWRILNSWRATRAHGSNQPRESAGNVRDEMSIYPLERNSSMETASATGVSNIG